MLSAEQQFTQYSSETFECCEVEWCGFVIANNSSGQCKFGIELLSNISNEAEYIIFGEFTCSETCTSFTRIYTINIDNKRETWYNNMMKTAELMDDSENTYFRCYFKMTVSKYCVGDNIIYEYPFKLNKFNENINIKLTFDRNELDQFVFAPNGKFVSNN